jgi:hypothetical protein
MGGLLRSDVLRLLYASLLFSSMGGQVLESERFETGMSVDIRRMNFEELEELNRSAKAWRKGNKPAHEPLPEPLREETLSDTQDSMREKVQPVQLNLF